MKTPIKERKQRKYSRAKKKVSNAVTQMNIIRRGLRSIALDRQTDRILQRNEKIRKLKPPKTKRGKEAHVVETYKKDDAGLSLTVHVPFNAKTRDFKKTGKGWIIVSDALPIIDGPRYYKEPIICSGRNFAKKICLHAKAVEWCIRHRPVSEVTGELMVPERDANGEYFFVSKNDKGEIVDSKKFFAGLPLDSELLNYVNKFINRKKGTFTRRKVTKAKAASTLAKVHKVEKVVHTGTPKKQQPAKQLTFENLEKN